jgi:Protein of unknown function (DUF4199)
MMGAPKKITITLLFGLIAAGCMTLCIFGTYWAGPQAFLGQAMYLTHAVVIVLAAVAAILEKRALGGVIGFRPALKTAFAVLVAALVAKLFFTWLLMNVIDRPFHQRVLPLVIENMVKTYHRFGTPEEEIQRAVDAEKGQDQFSLGRMITGTGFLIILHFIIAALIAATVRTKTPSSKKQGVKSI